MRECREIEGRRSCTYAGLGRFSPFVADRGCLSLNIVCHYFKIKKVSVGIYNLNWIYVKLHIYKYSIIGLKGWYCNFPAVLSTFKGRVKTEDNIIPFELT